MTNNPFADRVEPARAADILGVSKGTLEVWRCTGRYDLPYYKVGRRVFYRLADISSFLEARRQEPGK